MNCTGRKLKDSGTKMFGLEFALQLPHRNMYTYINRSSDYDYNDLKQLKDCFYFRICTKKVFSIFD